MMRRPSSESALSFIGRERGGSTLSDLVQQGNVDNDVSYFSSGPEKMSSVFNLHV